MLHFSHNYLQKFRDTNLRRGLRDISLRNT